MVGRPHPTVPFHVVLAVVDLRRVCVLLAGKRFSRVFLPRAQLNVLNVPTTKYVRYFEQFGYFFLPVTGVCVDIVSRFRPKGKNNLLHFGDFRSNAWVWPQRWVCETSRQTTVS